MINEKEPRFLLITLIATILFGFWFVTIKDVFSPFILATVIIAFLLPFRDHKTIRVLIALIFTLFMLWLIHELREIFTPFLIAFALAYLFDPVVDGFEKRKFSRTSSIVVIILAILGTLFAIGLLVIPQFAGEVSALAGTFPSYEDFKRNLNPDALSFLQSWGMDTAKIIAMIESETTNKITGLIREFTQSAQSLSDGLSSLITQLINLILIPFITFYFLRDFDQNITRIRSRTPERHRAKFEKLYTRIDGILSVYIRRIFLTAFTLGMLSMVILFILDIRFATIIGITLGLFYLIPYVGYLLTFAVGAIMGLLNPDPGSAVLKIMIVIACIKIIDLGIVSPRLVGEKLGLHPVLMIFSIFVFGKLLGLLGLFIAIPVTAILKVLIMEWYDQNFLHREFIRDDSSSTSKE